MAKHTVKVGISTLSTAALLVKGRTVASMLDGNAGYASLQARLPAYVALLDALDSATEAVLFNGGKVNYEAKRLAEEAVRNATKDLAALVQGISGGDRALILSAGFDTVKEAQPLPPPSAPAELIVRRTVEQGVLKVKWPVIYGSKMFFLEMQEKGGTEWVRIVTSTRTSHVIKGLVTGQEYSFRVQVVTTKGISPMSEVVTNIAA